MCKKQLLAKNSAQRSNSKISYDFSPSLSPSKNKANLVVFFWCNDAKNSYSCSDGRRCSRNPCNRRTDDNGRTGLRTAKERMVLRQPWSSQIYRATLLWKPPCM